MTFDSARSRRLGTLRIRPQLRLRGVSDSTCKEAARPSAALASVVRVNTFQPPIPAREFWLAVVPLHILAGWISVAVFAHLSSSITATGVVPREDPVTLLTILLVLSAALVGAS